MRKLTMNVLREFNKCYEFNLTEIQLKDIYSNLTFIAEAVTSDEILDEFELTLNN